MDVDLPALTNTPITKGKLSGVTPTPKPTQATTTVGHLAQAYLVHGVACVGSWQANIQEVETSFGRKGGGVIGVRWLLQQHRRRERAFSSLVVISKRAVATAQSMYMMMRGRNHIVEEYGWGRRHSHWTMEGW